ncbi:HAD domain-containing protein [Kineothrix sedimenti]|uniref:HAD domain-containing protein n=1 Tax=Kineothrix sedimenti TaxID=3123317 RepID=A0ABZ3F289_9FIRM
MAYFESLGMKKYRPHHDEISDYNLRMLSKIYHACDAYIVLSSTWRTLDDSKHTESYAMYKYLEDSLAKYDIKIMSKTPIINHNRPLEIKTWLDERVDRDDIKFVSLDDDFSKEQYREYGIEDCLIDTKFFCKELSEGGLQQEHVDRAIRILNGE